MIDPKRVREIIKKVADVTFDVDNDMTLGSLGFDKNKRLILYLMLENEYDRVLRPDVAGLTTVGNVITLLEHDVDGVG